VNEEMKMAATRALALLAREDVPESVSRLYGLRKVKFGPDYLIPFPFDPRVLLWVAPAVAWAAVATGVAGEFVDVDEYRHRLEARLGRARGIMRGIINRAVADPKRVVFPEGEEPKIIRAAQILVDEGIAHPVLLGNRAVIEQTAAEYGIPIHDVGVIDIPSSARREDYARYLWERRQRKGLSIGESHQRLYNANYYGLCMVALGEADALVSGVNATYPETIRPALEVIGAHPKAGILSGMYMLVFEKKVVFCGDTTVNIDPDAEQLAQIAYSASRIVRSFGEEPRVAMLSFSNFGSVRHADAEKVARAVALLRDRDPSLVVDGEMQADTALDETIQRERYPFKRPARRGQRVDLPQLERGEHRLQVTEPPRRGDGHRPDSRRDAPSRARPRAGRGRAGDREHGRGRGDGRAGALATARGRRVPDVPRAREAGIL
jgi:malate dehydrogenase (oxaloacetate-decarboxylating)(NADP+)